MLYTQKKSKMENMDGYNGTKNYNSFSFFFLFLMRKIMESFIKFSIDITRERSDITTGNTVFPTLE